MTNARTWRIDEELDEGRLLSVVTDLYDRLYADILVGFFFLPFPKERLIAHQVEYLLARLGPPEARYSGRSMRAAHESHPILPAHFDRRHTILLETLAAHEVPEHVCDAWVELDLSLRPLIIRKGAERRADILSSD